MITLKQLQPGEILHVDFPEKTAFQFLNDQYRVAFTESSENRMSYYVRQVEVFKNEKLFASGQTCDPEYVALNSIDKRYLFIPFESSYKVYDLKNGTSIKDNVFFLNGNHFDKTSRYLLTLGFNEYKLTDLEKGQSIFNYKDEKLFISQAHFGLDNSIWTISPLEKGHVLEKLNPLNFEKTLVPIPSPFNFFKIDLYQYKKLLDLNKHCLWIKNGGGMLHSNLLNKWQYVRTIYKSVYKTAIPVSDIRYSKNYNTDTCDIEFLYVAIEEQ